MQFIVPPTSNTALAKLQTVAAGGSVILNGNPQKGNFFGSNAGGYCERKISITSAFDLSDVNFTIRGFSNRWGNYQKGVFQTEILAGPDADTVQSENYYSSITSITVDDVAANFSVGSGLRAAVVMNVNTISPRFGYASFSFSVNNPEELHFAVLGTNHMSTTLPLDTIVDLLTPDVFTIVPDTAATTYQFPNSLAKPYPIVQTMIALLNLEEEAWTEPLTINYIEA